MSKRSAEEVNGGDERRRRTNPQPVPAAAQQHPVGPLYHATQPNVTRFYGFVRNQAQPDQGVVVRGRYGDAFLVEEFTCSSNRHRPCLTSAQLGLVGDPFLCGIVYLATGQTQNPRRFTAPGGVVIDISDVQSSVTGSVTRHAMTPFDAAFRGLFAADQRAFRANPMRQMITECGGAFLQMLRTEAMREVREETGLTGPITALEQVRVIDTWITFKIDIRSLQQDNDGCHAFALARPPPGDFVIPNPPGRGDQGIPLKVQVYIYGPRAEMKTRITNVTARPFVEAENRPGGVAGLMVYRAADAGQFYVV